MASVEYQNSILWRGEDPLKTKFQKKVDATKKVVRYFPGQKPKWIQDEENKEKEAQEKLDKKRKKKEEEEKQARKKRRQRDPTAAAVVVEERPAASSSSKPKSTENRLPRSNRFSAASPEPVRVRKAPSPSPSPSSSSAAEPEAPPVAAPTEAAVPAREDPRFKRLQQHAGRIDPSERMSRHRTIHEARVVEAKDEDEDEDEDVIKPEVKEEPRIKEEEMLDKPPVVELQLPISVDAGDDTEEGRALRREQMREAALARRKAEEELLKEEIVPGDDLPEEDEDESSYESESEDVRRGILMKPVFVTKAQRETVKEREAQEAEEAAAAEREAVRQAEKKAQSRSLLVETIKVMEEAEQAGVDENDGSDIELIDDDDEKNEAEEYELWKIRELKRIKRDKEERLERQKELELVERRRMMTDQEREEDDKRMDAGSAKRDEVKAFNFLQKYYHRGGFFQDKARTGEEPLYNRDYHEPTAEETFDKSTLPKAMQLRRGQFGKKGQVKHTHLTEADTTDMSAAWSQHSKVTQKYQEKMAAAKSVHVFDRPGSASGSTGH